MKKIVLKACLMFLAGSITLSSCKKTEDTNTNAQYESQATLDNAAAEGEFDDASRVDQDAMTQFDAQLEQGKILQAPIVDTYDGCATITIDQVAKTIMLDFGVDGCKGKDDRTRTGMIMVSYTAKYMTPGSIITTTFDNYMVDGRKIEGTKVVTNITEGKGNPTHSVKVTDGKITFEDGKTVTWESDRTREWVAGWDGEIQWMNPFDDVFNVTGTYSGKNKNDISFDAEIKEALEIKTECFKSGIFKPSKGKVEITATDKPAISVDYGDGTCDKTITITVDGKSKEITTK